MAKKRNVNKSEEIRDYQLRCPNDGPKAIAAGLAEIGIKVTPAFVSTIRSMDKRRAEQLTYSGIDPSTDMLQLVAAKRFAAVAGGIDQAIAALVSLKKLRSE